MDVCFGVPPGSLGGTTLQMECIIFRALIVGEEIKETNSSNEVLELKILVEHILRIPFVNNFFDCS